MQLDIGTLTVVTVFVTALLGALLVFAGLQNRNIRAPMWWGGSQIVCALGLACAVPKAAAPEFVTVDAANALVLLAYGLTWGGRVFSMDAKCCRSSLFSRRRYGYSPAEFRCSLPIPICASRWSRP
jgi:hypothetical protein